MQRRTYLAVFAVLALTAGCNQSDFGDPDAPVPPGEEPPGPGDPAWGSEDVSCENQDDCSINEACIESVCQMPRCSDGPYTSAAPLGPQHYFFNDLEVLTADDNLFQGNYWVDTYLPGGGALTYPSGGGSWQMGAYKITDVAGGNLLGTRPERFVVSQQGRSSVTVNGANPITMPLSFVPVAVGTGDVDHDSIDEVIAISGGNKFAICHADEQRCETFNFQSGVVGKDVAAGDIDGDGYDEPVLMIRANDKIELLAFNYNHEESGEEQLVGLVIDTDYIAMDVGDTDGDRVAEIYALEDGGWAGFAKDHVHVWKMNSTSRLQSKEVDADSKDISLADIDMSQADKLLVLRDTKTVEVYAGTPSQLDAIFTSDLAASTSPQRLAAADTDGDTPSARRISEQPEIIASEPVPVMNLHFPPYSKQHSQSLPYLFAGNGETVTEDFTDTVGLNAGIELGVGAEFPGIFSAEVTGSIHTFMEQSRTQSKQTTIGMRFKMDPYPEIHGDAYSVVVLSGACYHSYKYELSDPAGVIGGDGGEFILMVPVGGQTTVWSSKRYNALARALGTLPEVSDGVKLGDPSVYPSYPTTVDGSAVPAADMVFPQTPNFLVSDVSTLGWWLAVAETTTNSASIFTELSVRSSIKVAGFKVGSTVGGGFGTGYALSVGEDALFGGGVPPMPNNPDTPEDEYEANRFAFSPYVYREHYTNADGDEGGYYIVNFTVGE